MTIRRAIVWGISILFGAASAIGVIFVLNTTLEKFSLTGVLQDGQHKDSGIIPFLKSGRDFQSVLPILYPLESS